MLTTSSHPIPSPSCVRSPEGPSVASPGASVLRGAGTASASKLPSRRPPLRACPHPAHRRPFPALKKAVEDAKEGARRKDAVERAVEERAMSKLIPTGEVYGRDQSARRRKVAVAGEYLSWVRVTEMVRRIVVDRPSRTPTSQYRRTAAQQAAPPPPRSPLAPSRSRADRCSASSVSSTSHCKRW